MKNLGLKLFSLLIAAMLSYYVHSDSSESVAAITVPVELRGVPANRIVTAPFPREVQVSIKGPSFLLAQVYSSPPSFKIKVPQDVGQKFTASFSKTELGLPAGVDVISFEPSEMNFTIDTLVKKDLPVQLVNSGSLKNGLKISETILTPSTITVSGPQSELAAMKAIETEPFDLKEVNSDTERSLTLKRSGRLTEYSGWQVHLRLVLVKEQKERKFVDLPVEIRSVQRLAVNLQPAGVSIEVSGQQDKIDALSPDLIVPYVRLAAGDAPGKQYKVDVDLPKGISLVVVEPDKVKVVTSNSKTK